ncbi:alpha/beta hydrolase [Constantimarinum furrinae]|uniref:Alpha/beta hydrolase n=1 Tax=Constantimarinum furrinae TaxID=2562285 RepID=A0A7G8PS64_9FLAO|nr:alpha/beta hydrolase [Constantimarinum furrinae]QNJ97180.1 alpha/beta hydrolase [Constantimarinum furrinae]
MKAGFIFLILFLLFGTSTAQTYIGEIFYRDSYHYLKINCTEKICEVSLPYLDGDKLYQIDKSAVLKGDWFLERGVATWNFSTVTNNNTLLGVLHTQGGSEEILLWEQLESPTKQETLQYTGVYSDSRERRAILYKAGESFLGMSPFSERTKSLKRIGTNTFWTASGERWTFEKQDSDNFQQVTISDRFGNTNTLNRIPPITVEELWIPVANDTLYAKLFLPPSEVKTPACLVLPGGGATGMDNYEYEARFFAAYGMASLIFDKSGNGKSKGPGNFRLQTFEEKNEQYKQLFKFLQNHPKVDPKQVGVHGPSEGGRLAIMMAMDLQDIAFVNATAAPIMTMREGQLYAMSNYHRNLGVTEEDNIEIGLLWNAYYGNIIAGTIDPNVIEKANSFRKKYERGFLPPDLLTVPGAPRSEDITNDRIAAEAKNITCPVLLQYGENDERVYPTKSIQNFYEAVKDKSLVKVIIYNRSNHSFMTPEYEISTGYADDKIAWLRQIGILEY